MTSRKRPRYFGSQMPRPTEVGKSHRLQRDLASASEEVSNMERQLFGYFLSYSLLLVFVIVTALSTTELQLLIPKHGVILPFLGTSTSVRGFYIVSSFVICGASLFMARELWALEDLKKRKRYQNRYVFSRAGGDSEGRPLLGVKGDLDRIVLKFISDSVFFVSGPATIALLTFWFADAQDRLVFALQSSLFLFSSYFSWVFYRRTERIEEIEKCRIIWPFWILLKHLGIAVVSLKFLVCVDVIYLPTTISPTFFLRDHTRLLDTVDGGVSAFVPHIRIDRFTSIWNGERLEQLEQIAVVKGSPDANHYFMSRGVGLDLRHRRLRFLDIQFQTAPRLMVHYSDLSGANLSAARLLGSNFVGTKMYNVNMQRSVLDGSRFNEVDVKFGVWNNVSARGVVFDNTTIDESVLSNVNFLGSSFFGANITNSFLSGANFSATSFFQTDFKGNIFEPPEKFSVFISDGRSESQVDKFEKYFDENEEDAISALVDGFCTGAGKASDSNALYTISSTYLLIFPDRLQKISTAFDKTNCKSGSTAWSNNIGQ